MKFINHDEIIQKHECKNAKGVITVAENKHGWKVYSITGDFYINFCPFCGKELKQTEKQLDRVLKHFGFEPVEDREGKKE